MPSPSKSGHPHPSHVNGILLEEELLDDELLLLSDDELLLLSDEELLLLLSDEELLELLEDELLELLEDELLLELALTQFSCVQFIKYG